MGKRATLDNWTPKRAHSFAKRRIAKIETLLEEIAYVYADVDMSIDTLCTEVRDVHLKDVREAIDYALSEGRTV